uniref:CCHC-type domain-containing protein n=1 Tax=Tanacetum cinerariifolium TaxID=118510 RepID=A0A6L2M674_TANCI|nr:hypothetical protein [Tanacetum cinerariifolium]
MFSMAGEGTNQSSPLPIAPLEASQMVSSVKLPILKKGEYILWTMKMEHYLAHTDYALWEVILNGNGEVQMTKDKAGNEVEVPPITTQQVLARTRERKAKNTLLMAIPDEHLARFHGIKDTKTLWAAIKSIFGGNVESKKMQKNVLKKQFKNFSVSNSKGLDKGYDRFQRLLNLLEIHGACVSTKVANQKFLRSLPSDWNNILIMRNKPGIDNLDIDDLYNNLKVYEANIKDSSGSSSNSQNVAFVSAESTSSTNELKAAHSVSTATGHGSQAQGSSSYADELMFSYFANQSSSPQLDNEDLEQIDQDDLEEMDLKRHVAVLSMTVKRFYKKTRRKLKFNGNEPVGFDKTQVECFNCHKRGHFARDCKTARDPGYKGRDNGKSPVRKEDEKALVVQDGLGTYDWSYQLEEEATDFALMAFTSNLSSSSSSNSKEEVTETVFDNRSIDEENRLANDRFKKGKGFYAVLPPLTGKYMPPKPDLSFARLDDSIYKFKISETVTSLSKDVKNAPETSFVFVEKPKEVRTSAPLIQEWDTDSDNDSVFRPKHILAKINFIKADRMAKKSVLPNNVGKGTGHRESRLVWNNVQRINHPNKFAPTTVFTRSGRIPVSAAKPKAAASTSAAKPVNTSRPKKSVNFSNSRSTLHKSNSPIRRSFYNATTHSRINSTERVNTAESKAVSAVKGNRVTVVKALAGCVWRPRVIEIYQISKDNRWICTRVDYGHPQQTLKNKGIVDSGCSRNMTRNKAYLADYQEINDGGFSNFSSSRDPLGKFESKADEGFLVRYSVTSKAFRVFNTKTRKVEENLHVRFLENKPYVAGTGPNWLFDIDSLTNSMNYIPVYAGNKTDINACPQDTNGNAGTQENVDVGKEVSDQHHNVLPLWYSISSTYKSSDDKVEDDKLKDDTGSKTVVEPVNKEDQTYRDELDRLMSQEKAASDAVNSLSKEFEQGCMDQRGAAKAGSTNSFNTSSTTVNAAKTSRAFSVGEPSSPHPVAFILDGTLLHVDHDDSQILDLKDTTELRKADFNNMKSSIVLSPIPIHRVHIDHPKYQILGDPQSAVQTRGMEKKSSRAHAFVSYIHKQRRTNHKDYKNYLFTFFLSQMEPKKVAQDLDDESWVEAMQDEQEEWIDCDEVFALVARIEAIRIFLAFASFMRFIVYQMDVKSAFFYGTIEEEVYVNQPSGFIDPQFPNKVYKVEKALYGLHPVPRASIKKSLCDEFEALMHKRFQMSFIGELTFFLGLQVTPKLSHLYAVKQIFRYLKCQTKLGLWYPRDYPFDVEAYSDSDYAGANLDRKFTTGGCQFLNRRLISWQCKKQTTVATSTTEAEYVVAAN